MFVNEFREVFGFKKILGGYGSRYKAFVKELRVFWISSFGFIYCKEFCFCLFCDIYCCGLEVLVGVRFFVILLNLVICYKFG